MSQPVRADIHSIAGQSGTHRISVVMPVFNGGAFLRQAIESVLNQNRSELELLAVDDGSTDGSDSVLEHFAERDARVRVITHPTNLGIVAALNRGVCEARSEYVAIANADDVSAPDRLTRQAALLDSCPRLAAVGTALQTINETGKKGPRFYFPTNPTTVRSTLMRHNCLAHPSVMFRRSAVMSAGGYRFDYVEDYDLWLRLSQRFDLASLAEPLVLYRLHARQLSLSQLEEMQRRRLIVRAAARVRGSDRPDPLTALDSVVSVEQTAALGISEQEVARAVRAEWLSRAAVLSELNQDDAERIAAEAASTLGPRAPRTIRAGRELLRAENQRSARRPLKGLLHVGRAFRHDPVFASARSVSWISDRSLSKIRRPR